MKIKIKKILDFLFFMTKDYISLVKNQNQCDLFDIFQIILFGLLINALFGVIHSFGLLDLLITVFSSYGIMRFRKDIKEEKC